MSVADLAFVDTNIWAYRLMHFEPDEVESLAKRRIASELLDGLAAAKRIIISSQVLGEFFMTMTRKGKRPLSVHDAFIETNWLSTFPLVTIDADVVRSAMERVRDNRINYWDALIVASAVKAGATILYSEDMHRGTRYGTLEIRNPFL